MISKIEWRAPTLNDVAAIEELAAICDERNAALETTLVDGLAALLRSHDGMSEFSRVVTDEGSVIGAGWVRISSTAKLANSRRCLYAYAAPDHPEIYAELLRWLDGVAAKAFGEGDVVRIERVLRTSTPDLPEPAIELYASLGYARFYVEHEMSRHTTAMSASRSVDGIAIASWIPGRHAEIRDAYNDAFQQRGFEGYSPDGWLDAYCPDDVSPTLSFVAFDRGLVVGFIFCTVLDDHRDASDWTDPAIAGAGRIDTVGVRPSHQGRGIASGLIARATDAFRASGVDRVVLRVNEDNEWAAGVYRKLGFQAVRKHIVYKRNR